MLNEKYIANRIEGIVWEKAYVQICFGPGSGGAVNPSFRILWTEAVTIYVKGIKLE